MSDDKTRRNARMQKFANLLEDIVHEIKPSADFSWRKMFGGAGYYVDGVMFGGMYIEETIGLKLNDSDRDALLAIEGPAQGMGKNTIEVPVSMLDDPSTLKVWVEKSLDYAASRPPKKKKKK